MQDIHKLLVSFSGQRNIIVIPRALISLVGGYEEAALLSQIMFWGEKMGGRFYKTAADFAEELAMSARVISRCRDKLETAGFIETKIIKAPSGAPTLHWICNLDTVLDRLALAGETLAIPEQEKPARKMTEDPSVLQAARDAIDYLNNRAARKFKPTESTLKYPLARLREGFSRDDLMLAVNNQVRKWLGDPKMSQYLRPETIFGTKMQGYIQTQGGGQQKRIVDASRPVAHQVEGDIL